MCSCERASKESCSSLRAFRKPLTAWFNSLFCSFSSLTWIVLISCCTSSGKCLWIDSSEVCRSTTCTPVVSGQEQLGLLLKSMFCAACIHKSPGATIRTAGTSGGGGGCAISPPHGVFGFFGLGLFPRPFWFPLPHVLGDLCLGDLGHCWYVSWSYRCSGARHCRKCHSLPLYLANVLHINGNGWHASHS